MRSAWETAAATVLAPERYEERLDVALALASEAAGLPDAYLYLVDASERRLHLAQSRARAAADPSRAAAGPLFEHLDGGAEWSAPTVPLELVRAPEMETERNVTTSVGTMHSLPLHSEGRLVGLLQLGPLGRRRPRRAAGRLGELAAPLGFVIARARVEENFRLQLAAAEARLEGGRRLAGAAVDLDSFVGLLLDLALNSTGARSGFVAIVAQPGEVPVVRAETGMAPGFAQQVDLSPDGGLFDWSPSTEGGALVLADFEAAERLSLGSPIAVPLLEQDEPLGILALDFGPGGSFDENALTLLEAFASQIRLMLHNARLFATFSDSYVETVKGLATALDARRPHTRDHHARVAAVAVALVRELDGSEEEAWALREAGLIHDVGLAGAIAVEGGSDADVEHPTLGASLIEHLPLPASIAGAIATHHEWVDGWGFPRGLRDEEIPRSGRILGLAEFVVEMETGDPVREPWDSERIAAEIEQRRGSQFDPAVADAALRLAARGQLEPTTVGR
ncbi:MAG TPA: HD domain-containing phosphohydrolase [Solirubrobacterales bacterium]|nr:HD domain-containing phosphohydrolase [Solirubrobacterales bacterium]